ncbi:hypothetical protein [Streptomyces sp. NPDC059224]|uniref:hypothetical protein n=1 Tax=Streptomyces sp. NPDC059224 TaxID=3346775 RepID=UPI0036A215E4
MRIVRGTRRGGSLDMALAVAMGVALVVPLAGNPVVALAAAGTVGITLALDRALVVALALDWTLAVVRPVLGRTLAVPLTGRPPVPGLPGLRTGVWRRSPG